MAKDILKLNYQFDRDISFEEMAEISKTLYDMIFSSQINFV